MPNATNLDPDSYVSSERLSQDQLASHPYDIVFRKVIFNYHFSLGKINQIEQHPFTIQIPEGEKVLLL